MNYLIDNFSKIFCFIFSISFGSKVLGPETDIIYNNEMDDFSTPNTTNSFGVPASPANYITPGKRPVSSMAPVIIMEKSTQRIQLVLGASGGTRITTSIAQVAMLNLWFNEDIKQAIDSPRLHSQLLPEEVIAERGFDPVRRIVIDYWNFFIYFILDHFKIFERTWS
jgi:gamma-glutamyltranspeptidase/glutathione hydrolase/leukotriene-C4 hydrolase